MFSSQFPFLKGEKKAPGKARVFEIETFSPPLSILLTIISFFLVAQEKDRKD